MNDPRELEHLKNYRPSIDDLKMKSPALISEGYVEKAKYDEAVRQRDELREALKRFTECMRRYWADTYQEETPDLSLVIEAEAAIKNTET